MSEYWLQTLVAIVFLGSLWLAESIVPFVVDHNQSLRNRILNIGIGIFNLGIVAVLFVPAIVFVTDWININNVGLLQMVELPIGISMILAVLLIDGWMYIWHRANHRVPFLWRFHRVHHSDTDMNTTTAVRFHTGEIMISGVLRLGVAVAFGLSLWHFLLYDLLLIPVIAFHHSNIRFPERWDYIYRSVFASPAMHRLHHSVEKVEADSNYGSIFSFWDRIAGSLVLVDIRRRVKYGIENYPPKESRTLTILVTMPFRDKSSLGNERIKS